ncbi:MAG TPA: hypothetical protein VMF07_00465 [Solirubrobacteraceae bacterium]|nr:hypothetical protein [Solirubrobacteraceae bacterium]
MSFLEDDDARAAPRLRTGPAPGAEEIELTDRARWVLAAISLPRELAPDAASDERQRARLGSRLWSSGEITDRIPYQHRSTIRLALGDLRSRLGERELALEDYLVIDTERGRYGVRGGQITVDVVDLYAVRHDPAAVDRLLDAALEDRRRAQLAAVCSHLLGEAPLAELETAIGASAVRACVPARSLPQLVTVPDPPPAETAPSAHAEPGPIRRERRLPRRRGRLIRGLAAILVVAAAAAVIPMLASGHHRRVHALGPPRREVSGGVAHTWSDPQLAGGRSGPEIMPHQAVMIACRLKGFKVPDGNVWWYLLASPPWSQRYYATADTFYNNGRTSGSLRGSAFVDPKVARCS